MGLKTQEQKVGQVAVFRLEGRIDAVSSGVLEKALHNAVEKNHAKVALDFAKVDYLSSAGMRLLLATTKKLKATGGMLVLFSVHENVMEIIRMAGFEKILHIYSLESEALRSLSS